MSEASPRTSEATPLRPPASGPPVPLTAVPRPAPAEGIGPATGAPAAKITPVPHGASATHGAPATNGARTRATGSAPAANGAAGHPSPPAIHWPPAPRRAPIRLVHSGEHAKPAPPAPPRPPIPAVRFTDAGVVRVTVPERSFASELRAMKIVWQREMTRFWADRLRIVTSLAQPFLFLFILGVGLQRISSGGTYGVPLRTFIYPGILCMSVMFASLFSAASFVWDREFGFLREMMVAPVRRSSIVIGKCLAGATVGSIQGLIVLAIAGAVKVPYTPAIIFGVFGIQLLLAFTITAMGMMIGVRIKQMQSFMGVAQMILLPMFFISGAMFPASGLPTWLSVLNRLDPMSYAVDPMRRLVFSQVHISAAAHRSLDSGLSLFGYHLPALVEVGVILALGIAMLSIAALEFSTIE